MPRRVRRLGRGRAERNAGQLVQPARGRVAEVDGERGGGLAQPVGHRSSAAFHRGGLGQPPGPAGGPRGLVDEPAKHLSVPEPDVPAWLSRHEPDPSVPAEAGAGEAITNSTITGNSGGFPNTCGGIHNGNGNCRTGLPGFAGLRR